MLTVISPAKRLDETPQALPAGLTATEPDFHADARRLARVAGALSVDGLRKLMAISEPLARLNHARFAAFGSGARKAAAFCFDGDTYAGLEARTLPPDALVWAQGHLRILSGLYGMLRPLDAIEAYRLEMGSKLANAKGRDLYAFWGTKIARALQKQAAEVGARVLVNCASVEYFHAVDQKALKLPVITPQFLEQRGAETKVISFCAKRARGAMARFICEHNLTDPDDLRGFAQGGYVWQAELSRPGAPVFLRAEQASDAA